MARVGAARGGAPVAVHGEWGERGYHPRLVNPGCIVAAALLTSYCITRDHEDNLSCGPETYLPPRLLHGVLPSALLDAYDFWQAPQHGKRTPMHPCPAPVEDGG